MPSNCGYAVVMDGSPARLGHRLRGRLSPGLDHNPMSASRFADWLKQVYWLKT